MKHEVRTFNAKGKMMNVQSFENADKAYKEYENIKENLKKHLPKGYGCTIIRYRDDVVMTSCYIEGTV